MSKPWPLRCAVIGAGQMGSGIAQLFAQAGCELLLVDQSQAFAEKGKQGIGRQLERLVHKGKLTAELGKAALARIHCEGTLETVSKVDLVVEAVSEKLELKADIVARLDAVLSPDAILASNTSSISITQLAAATQHPERVIGMHFMNPAPVMTLVELIRGLQTSDACYARVSEITKKLGKEMVTSQDRPGFIVNRLLVPLINEACFALQEGLATAEDIDSAVRLGLNHPMGPLALADMVGLDTVLAIAEILHRDLGEDKYRPAYILRQHVAAGRLGRKSGQGFYVYS